MQTQKIFFTKVNTYFCSAGPMQSKYLRVALHLILKSYFRWLLVWDDEVLATPKITTFLTNLLPKLHIILPWSAILQLL